jgi:UDP-glucuronate 4-epimerase
VKRSKIVVPPTPYEIFFITATFPDRMAWKNIYELKPDAVVNLAAQAGVRYSLDHPHEYIDSNIMGFLNVLEGCRHHGVKHLVFASSSSVYGGNTKIPFAEEDRVDNPVSLYAATKKSNELMAHAYAHLFHFPVTGLRFTACPGASRYGGVQICQGRVRGDAD